MSSLKGLTKTKSKKKKVKAFHQKVKVFRANDPKLAVLMWGVSHSISQLSHVPSPVMLLKDDFKAYSKIKIDNHFYNNLSMVNVINQLSDENLASDLSSQTNGDLILHKHVLKTCLGYTPFYLALLRENMPGHFKFKEYMPVVFRNLRERFAIDERLFARSFLIQPKLIDVASKSNDTKFLLTKDKTFYIKTMEREEVEMMHHMMPSYHQHIVECHSETLLPQYVGMYRTTIDNKEYYYLVIRNVFSSKRNIHKKYVLKGRQSETKENKDIDKHQNEAAHSLKDIEFLTDYGKLIIGQDAKKFLMDKFKRDVDFLASQNILDYSLLVGVHDIDKIDSDPDDDELDGEDYETGEDSADGLDDPPSPSDDLDGGVKFQRTDSVRSAEVCYDYEYYAVPCSDSSVHEIYYLGLMDVLMYYGASKKAQHAAKTVKHGMRNMRRSLSEPGTKRWSFFESNPEESANTEHATPKPQFYGTKFLDFINSILE